MSLRSRRLSLLVRRPFVSVPKRLQRGAGASRTNANFAYLIGFVGSVFLFAFFLNASRSLASNGLIDSLGSVPPASVSDEDDSVNVFANDTNVDGTFTQTVGETASIDYFLNDGTGVSEIDASRQIDETARQFEKKNIGGSTLYTPVVSIQDAPIVVSAQYGWKGADDEYGEVYVLCGDCRVTQGSGVASAPIAVVWSDVVQDETGCKVRVYLERDKSTPITLELDSVCASAKTNGDAWLGTFQTSGDVDLRIATPGEEQLAPDEVYFRALGFLQRETSATNGNLLTQGENAPNQTAIPPAPQARNNGLEKSRRNTSDKGSALGWVDSGDGDSILEVPETVQNDVETSTQNSSNTESFRRWRFYNRYDQGAKTSRRTDSGDGKDVLFLSNGFTLVVQGFNFDKLPLGDTIELSADQATVWLEKDPKGLFPSLQSEQETSSDLDFEIYLDGNVVFRVGENVIYAKKMYYDVKNRVGIIENAELVAETPGVEDSYFRIGASRIVQTDPNTLYATNAWASTSMMGEPRYRLQSDSIYAHLEQNALYDATTKQALVDPKSGAPLQEKKEYLRAENNVVTVGCLPVFYWPWMAMELKDRSLYMSGLKFGHDNVLGTQARSSWNPFQLFNMTDSRPEGVDWDLNLDYLSKRGFGHGTTLSYSCDSFGCSKNSRAVGLANFYGIYDKGKDNLGRGRRALTPEKKYRYRGIWKHRQELSCDCATADWLDGCQFKDGWLLTAQLGYSSDRNYIPQFFEDEWNTSSNPQTSFELKNTVNNASLGLTTSVRTNSFYTQSNWLPRLDHYWLGQALCDSPFVWYEHTKVGYAQFKATDAPGSDEERALFRYLDWELAPESLDNQSGCSTTLARDGVVFSSRQEVDLPLVIGPIKTTPYALGEYGFWGEGISQKNISRLYGRLGVRFNLPVWKVDSEVESKTWYLNGLAHKMNFTADVSFSDANKSYTELVAYDQIDDWQVEDFRRRYSVTTYSGEIPVSADERYYAIRQGIIAGNVTSPSTELADDLKLVRLGWDNRWQTKRGPVGNRRVVDWITFNAGLNLYPEKEQNFGKVPGFLDYDSSWQVGDRFAVLSSGLYDFWGTGQKLTRIGVQRRRPGLSSCYLGVDRLSGPIDSTYLNFGITYRTSEKWGLGFSNSYDLSEGYNIGQKATISRIGESFVVTIGASRNESKDNWGVNLSIEPVFMFDKNKQEEGLLGLGNM